VETATKPGLVQETLLEGPLARGSPDQWVIEPREPVAAKRRHVTPGVLFLARFHRQRGWKKKSTPTSTIPAATTTRRVDLPAKNRVRTPIKTSGKPTPSAGPAAHGELFSGKR